MRRVILLPLLLAACGGGGGEQRTGSNSAGGEASSSEKSGGAGEAQVQEQTPVNATIDPQNSYIPLEPPPYARNASAPAAPQTPGRK